VDLNFRNKILSELWESKEVNDAIKKMHPVELQDDLKSEVFLVLAELDYQKLIDLYKRNQIKFYMVRIMLNYVQSTDKKFYTKYRNFVEYKQADVADVSSSDITKEVNDSLDEIHWYQKEIIKLYTFKFNKNAKELSRQTGIPYMSIIRTLNQAKKELKKKIRK
jgi:hypothetical protein